MTKSPFLATVCLSIATTLAGWLPAPCQAQAPKKEKIPKPEPVTFDTRDGWTIHATYYGGTLKKEAVPILMLHGWKGQRNEYKSLALHLQALGHAVLCPDLRGHGQSTSNKFRAEPVIDPDAFRPNDLKAMGFDIEACKRFLLEKNNAGELNIDSLCLVAADFSCILALQWSAADWNAQRIGSFKQGQDVKALVMLSPIQSHKGLVMRDALNHPAIRSELSMMLVTGLQDTKSDAKQIFSRFENFRPDQKKQDLPIEDRTLFLVELETNLHGTKLLNDALNLKTGIENFVNLRLAKRQAAFSWSERKNPLSD
ncbi:MAG: alpha/beta fold hydrolase [Pirellulaceae bacterium]